MSQTFATRSPRARGSRRITVVVLAPVLASLVACGQSNGGTTAAPAASQCSATACTVSFPAKARNGQASSGGPGTTVLGVPVQLIEIGQGAATLRVGTAPAVNINQGQSSTVGGLTATVTTLSSTEAVVSFKKA